MGMRSSAVGWGVVGLLLVVPSGWAADGEPVPAAQVGVDQASLEQIRQAIEAETDPELKAAMEEQLELLESGELDLRTLEGDRGFALGAPPVGGEIPGGGGLPTGTPVAGGLQARGLPDTLPGGGLLGPPVEIGEGEGMPSYMTPELREKLFNVYDGVARGEVSEEEARAKAEEILKEHGIDPREIGPGHEGEWKEGEWKDWEHENPFKDDPLGGVRGPEALEHLSPEALEHMSPEAREQLERFYEQRELEGPEAYREIFEREYGTEPLHEYEHLEPAFEAPELEPTFEAPTYEAPTPEYEAPTQDYEAPMPEYDAPEYDQQAPEYEMPREYEYQAPPSP